jgi:biopolymer transport protein ExbD
MISRLHRRRRSPTSELQITAFMNLMVVLVPFLLITAVFSQMAVLELALPEPAAEDSETPPDPGLRIEIREAALVVLDDGGPLQRIERLDDGSIDTAALAELLAQIKERLPNEDSITLLLEPQVPYEDLVRVMDAVRVDPEDSEQPMFPDIAIGEARSEDPA